MFPSLALELCRRTAPAFLLVMTACLASAADTNALLPAIAGAATASLPAPGKKGEIEGGTSPPMEMQAPVELPALASERTSYSSINIDRPVIAMTFDDGPDALLTPRLLDILKQRNIKATFFVLGQLVEVHPEIVARAIAEGHEVGNHSWDHKALNKLGEGGLQHEIADTSAVISKVTGKPVTLMRPPYGATNARLNRAIEKEYGMKVIMWTVDPFDWDKSVTPDMVHQRIMSGWKKSPGVKPGSIILSHDIHKGTIEAMPATLDDLLAKGYKFVTVSELLALESKTPAPSASPKPAAQKPSKPKKIS